MCVTLEVGVLAFDEVLLPLQGVHLHAGRLWGIARKPTTLGTNLELTLPDPRVHGGRSREDGPDMDSRELARWAPGMMREIATALTQQAQDKQVMMRKLSWQEHVANGHVSFRRDCVICQRASASRRPHRRQEHPEAHVLALDLCGPLEWGNDIDGDEKRYHYLLVGSYTWPAEGKEPIDLDDDGASEDEIEVEGEEPLPQLDDEERAEDRRESVRQAGERREEEDEARRRAERGEVEEAEEGDDEQMKEDEEKQEEGGAPRNREKELEEKFKAKKVLKLMTCVPLPSKSSMDVLSGTQEIQSSESTPIQSRPLPIDTLKHGAKTGRW